MKREYGIMERSCLFYIFFCSNYMNGMQMIEEREREKEHGNGQKWGKRDPQRRKRVSEGEWIRIGRKIGNNIGRKGSERN